MSVRGVISRIVGPFVTAKNVTGLHMYELVRVGEEGIIGEVIGLSGDNAFIQVYEETVGLRPGEPVEGTGKPLSVELGPGLVGHIFDGIQRPLYVLQEMAGFFIRRGLTPNALDRSKRWLFHPTVEPGSKISGGSALGYVNETPIVKHKILAPPDVEGSLEYVAPEGEYTVEDTIAEVRRGDEKIDLRLMHSWPVRKPRPYRYKIPPDTPLITGQRVIDTFFPVAKGGTAAVPGGFGTGKCVTPDTPILLSDGEVLRADELFSRMAKKGLMVNDGCESYVLCSNPVSVIGLHQGELSDIASYIAYRGRSKRMVKIKTRKGRSVVVTPTHPLFAVTRELKIVKVPAGNAKPGMYILAPRRLRTKACVKPLSLYEVLDEGLRCCDPEVAEDVSRTLKALAERYGSLKNLAKVLGVSYSVVLGYYSRRNRPTLGFLRGLSKLAGRRFRVKTIKGERRSTPIRVPEGLSPELAEFLGLMLSDGSIIGGSIRFFNNDEEVLERFSRLCIELFNVKPRRVKTRTVVSLIVHSVALAKVLEKLGVPKGRKSDSCRIPKFIMRACDHVLTAFLNGYFAGDSSVYGYTLEVSTASRNMWIDLAYALTRLGILYRLSEKQINGKAYYRVSVEGRSELKVLYENLSNCYEYTYLRKIRAYIEKNKRGFNSVDVVPIGGLELKRLTERLGVGRRVFERWRVHIRNYTALSEKPSVKAFKKIVDLLVKFGKPRDGEDLEALNRLRAVVKLLDHVYFDKIAEVEVLELETPVYDLSIPETENFVGGVGPLILHNTVLQHTLAKFADADIAIFVGCGERGNEMAGLIDEISELKIPGTDRPLLDRTILIVNTSNMPIAAREASIYTGITIAEYYRDMGYSVILMADSTSRWAEALREICGRLEEMPGEEGYPAYLTTRLAEFYSRAGRVVTLGGEEGSVAVVGAVSPPGADFSEPVTQSTLRLVKVFWALDFALAHKRHFPAINWLTSYSMYFDSMRGWYEKHIAPDWVRVRGEAMNLLREEEELRELVALLGPEVLTESQRLTLEVARMVREYFLRQSAFHPIDAYCPPDKTYQMLKLILKLRERMNDAVERGVPLTELLALPIVKEVARMKILPYDEFKKSVERISRDMDEQIGRLVEKVIRGEEV